MFTKRRKEFIEKIDNGVAIIRNPDELIRNNDAHYKYRTDSDFYYLTGFSEPNSVAVFAPNHPEHKFILFVRPRDPERETWDGKRAGLEGAVKEFGADISYDIKDLDEKLPEYIKNIDNLYYTIGLNPDFDQKIIGMINNLRRKGRAGEFAPSSIIDSGKITSEMRLFKSPEEMNIMRKANYISQEAHIQAMKSVRAGMFEYEVEGLIDNVFRKNGCYSAAYNSIVGTGVNATILHYTENNKELKDGDLLLIDAGAEYGYYAGDITRTFPVNGKFTQAQREVYEVVLDAQKQSTEMVKPGIRFIDIHNKAVEVLTKGMIKLGLLKGDLETLIKEEKYKQFYMHKTGHWLGMDVHDVGRYFEKDLSSRTIEEGMVMTIEPGLYIQENTKDVPEQYIGIGIRIEDDILVTKNGYENLSERVPKEIDEIEKLMAR